jgi:hypothetical protein
MALTEARSPIIAISSRTDSSRDEKINKAEVIIE